MRPGSRSPSPVHSHLCNSPWWGPWRCWCWPRWVSSCSGRHLGSRRRIARPCGRYEGSFGNRRIPRTPGGSPGKQRPGLFTARPEPRCKQTRERLPPPRRPNWREGGRDGRNTPSVSEAELGSVGYDSGGKRLRFFETGDNCASRRRDNDDRCRQDNSPAASHLDDRGCDHGRPGDRRVRACLSSREDSTRPPVLSPPWSGSDRASEARWRRGGRG